MGPQAAKVYRMGRDLSKQDLYESVKKIVELDSAPHIHLNQHKLFTLFSIGFQYMLFRSTKNPGSYIIRVEDSQLAEKLAKKAKDPSTRKFMQSLLVPRKLKFQRSTMYLDFFHIGSWNLTKDLPPEKIEGVLIVKNTSTKPMDDMAESEVDEGLEGLPEDYYFSMIKDIANKTLLIAFDEEYEGVETCEFPFIKKDPERSFKGVTLSKDIDSDLLE